MIPDFVIRMALYGALVAGALGSAYVKGRIDEQHKQQLATLNATIGQYKVITKEVTRYVEKLKYINTDPGVVAGRLDRMCREAGLRAADTGRDVAPDGTDPGAPGPDADIRDLAAEDITVVQEFERCDSVFAMLRDMQGNR